MGWALANRMRYARLLVVSGLLFCVGCSAIGTRVGGDRYFSGVRADAAVIGGRASIDPASRVHPVLAAVDMPFSLVADILFLPYDAWLDCQSGSGSLSRPQEDHPADCRSSARQATRQNAPGPTAGTEPVLTRHKAGR